MAYMRGIPCREGRAGTLPRGTHWRTQHTNTGSACTVMRQPYLGRHAVEHGLQIGVLDEGVSICIPFLEQPRQQVLVHVLTPADRVRGMEIGWGW